MTVEGNDFAVQNRRPGSEFGRQAFRKRRGMI
jgi:hypothetical protein